MVYDVPQNNSLASLNGWVTKLEAGQAEAKKEILDVASRSAGSTLKLKEEVCWGYVMDGKGKTERCWGGWK